MIFLLQDLIVKYTLVNLVMILVETISTKGRTHPLHPVFMKSTFDGRSTSPYSDNTVVSSIRPDVIVSGTTKKASGGFTSELNGLERQTFNFTCTDPQGNKEPFFW